MSNVLTDWKGAALPDGSPVDGRYVLLEKLEAEKHGSDLWSSLCSAGSDPDQFKFLPFGPFENREEFNGWLRRRAVDVRTHNYAVVNKAIGKAEGFNFYLCIKPDQGTIEVGQCLGAIMQRSPRSTEARYLLVNNAFSLGYRRVECSTASDNVRAQRSTARSGYRYEGTMNQKYVLKGRAIDALFYAYLEEDWRTIKTGFERWLSEENQTPDGQKQRLEVLIKQARDETK